MKNRTYTKILIFFLWVLFLIPSVYAASSQTSEGKYSPRQKVRIIGDVFYPPYEWLDSKGEPQGLSVDLIKEAMARLKMPYTIELMSRKEIIQEAKKKKADIILGLTYTNERTHFIKFGHVYNYAFKNSVYRKNTQPIIRFEQLNGKRIVVEKGSYTESLVRSSVTNAHVYSYVGLDKAFIALNAGQYDAIVCDQNVSLYFINQLHLSNLRSSEIELSPQKYCLAGTNDSLVTKVSLIFFDLKKEGIYDKLYDKWFVKDNKAYYFKIFYFVLSIVVGLMIFIFIFNILLQKRIKKVREDLSKNEKNLAISLHAGNIGIWGYDVQSNRFYNVFCDYFPPEGMDYSQHITIYHPNDAHIFAHALQAASNGYAKDKSICVRMKSADGRWRYMEKEMHPLSNAKGVVTKVIGSQKDITDIIAKQNRINQLLKEHEIIFNHTSIGTQYYDSEGYLTNINDAACAIFGIEDKWEVLSAKPNIFDNINLKPYISRDNIKCVYCIIETDFDKMKESEYFKNIKKHGLHYIETYITPVVDDDGKLKCIIVNNSDFTEREKLQKQVTDYAFRMKYILKSSGIITWTYNPYTHIRIANAASNDKSDEMSREMLLQIVDPSDLKKMTDIINQMDNRTMEAFCTQIKYNHTYVDTIESYYTVHGTPIRDSNGKIDYYIGLCINVSDLIEIQLKLEHEKEEACKADKLKSAFLANVSHEIRTPLNSIVGFSDLLQYTQDEKEKKQFIDIIKSNNDHLLKIVDDVLNLSEIESGTMAVYNEEIDIEALIYSIIEKYETKVNPNVRLIGPDEPNDYLIHSDTSCIIQVLSNFLSNAIKFTTQGHIKMSYKCNGKGIRLYVEDTGKGIPTEKQQAIFERFEKIDTFVQGSGLGLSICKGITQLLGGEIGLESTEGKGSTFWIWIPCQYRTTSKINANKEVLP